MYATIPAARGTYGSRICVDAASAAAMAIEIEIRRSNPSALCAAYADTAAIAIEM
jgi:hypothetical protein